MSTGSSPDDRLPRACNASGSDGCRLYWPGHHMHVIHARKIGESPWGWRDALVTHLGPGGWLTVDYVLEDGRMVGWHHEDLSDVLTLGSPVRVHEGLWSLAGRFGWVNLFVREGAGAIEKPNDPEQWDGQVTGGVVDLSTGRALPLDHLDDRPERS